MATNEEQMTEREAWQWYQCGWPIMKGWGRDSYQINWLVILVFGIDFHSLPLPPYEQQ